jgi:hypothetical protein
MNDPLRKYYNKISENDYLSYKLQNQIDKGNSQLQKLLYNDMKNLRSDIDKRNNIINVKKVLNPEEEANYTKQKEQDKYIELNDKYASTARDELLNRITSASDYPLTLNDNITNDYKKLKKNMLNIMTNPGSIESIVNELTIEDVKKLNNNFINTQNKYIKKYGFNNPNLTNKEIKTFLLNEISKSPQLELKDIEGLKIDMKKNLNKINDNVVITLKKIIDIKYKIENLKNANEINIDDYNKSIEYITELEKLVENIERNNKKLKNDIDSNKLISENEYNILSADNEQLIKEYSILSAENEQLIKGFDKLSELNDHLVTSLRTKNDEIKSFRNELDELFKSGRVIMDNNQQEIQNLKNDVDELYKNKEISENKNQELFDTLNKLNNDNFLLNRKLDELQNVNIENKQINELKLELDNTLNKLREAENAIELFKIDIEINKFTKGEKQTFNFLMFNNIEIKLAAKGVLEFYSLKPETLKSFVEDVNAIKVKEEIPNTFSISNSTTKRDLILYLLKNIKLFEKIRTVPVVQSSEKKSGEGINKKKNNNKVLFGDSNIYINKKKLLHDNILSLTNDKSLKFSMCKNKKVSNLFSDLILNIIDNKTNNKSLINSLDKDEKLLYNGLLRAGNLHKVHNIDIDDNIKELKNRFSLLEGEVIAGNTNEKLLDEIQFILRKMIDFKLISTINANKYIKQIKNVNK